MPYIKRSHFSALAVCIASLPTCSGLPRYITSSTRNISDLSKGRCFFCEQSAFLSLKSQSDGGGIFINQELATVSFIEVIFAYCAAPAGLGGGIFANCYELNMRKCCGNFCWSGSGQFSHITAPNNAQFIQTSVIASRSVFLKDTDSSIKFVDSTHSLIGHNHSYCATGAEGGALKSELSNSLAISFSYFYNNTARSSIIAFWSYHSGFTMSMSNVLCCKATSGGIVNLGRDRNLIIRDSCFINNTSTRLFNKMGTREPIIIQNCAIVHGGMVDTTDISEINCFTAQTTHRLLDTLKLSFSDEFCIIFTKTEGLTANIELCSEDLPVTPFNAAVFMLLGTF